MTITKVKGHEPRLYESLRVIAGPFSKFTIVKMKGPNKSIKLKKNSLKNIAIRQLKVVNTKLLSGRDS